jgi:hypothetical protein
MSSSAVLRSRIRTHICRERGTLACAQSFVRLQGERQRQHHEGDTHEVFSGTANRRLFSSQPLRSKQYHLALTHHVLDHHKLPLGTMTGNQMDAALLSCQQQVEEITPFALHAAERLLQRLQYECASGNFFAQKYSNDLIDLYPKVHPKFTSQSFWLCSNLTYFFSFKVAHSLTCFFLLPNRSI